MKELHPDVFYKMTLYIGEYKSTVAMKSHNTILWNRMQYC